ncbi:Uncharacterized protein involved in cytokinesis%2C contains TGc (transglutaminase/protease-like) domain [uncultured Coprococcus sp.]|uniref:transglutaminase domain-containing protein n=1 Tax=Coprococcus ammoniilyticus TaxID=2981785 RepID=UPI0008235180|nr:transglutaminase domain-containing protein [Coprococcus ammoniilyticus]MCU6729712.1 transglutaminase [Coprococcus ammoniilyticus]SCH00260.1 Uncharacterized protein involved in cytokinesis%2C contains TGc (transglutaminase/protease-like) domain [uncultured Coprococcus sp.]
MRKKLLLFIIAAIFTFSSMTVLAAEDTADKDAKDKKSAAATIDTSLYYYNNFDNDAYRDAYNQLKEAADAFHNSNQNAEYENANTENSYYKAFSINVTSKTWEVIGPTGMQAVINAFLADNPTYFWMSPSFNYSTKSLDGGAVCYNVEIVCYNDYANGSSRQVIKNNIDISVSNLAGNLEKDLPDYQKEYLIHNAIIEDTYFQVSNENSHSGLSWSYTVDGIFNAKHKTATSFGYAKAFKAVMDAIGVKCIYVEGNTKENDDSTYNSHAWNMVYLDDGWYIVDLAYDHPETTSGKNVLIYDYFNITSDEASDLNPASDWLPGIPTCTGTAHSIDSIQSTLEAENIWQEDNYNFFDKILDKYGVSVVLISLGVIIILIVTLVKRIHKRRKARRVEKIKNTKTVTIDHSELDEELRRPPLS